MIRNRPCKRAPLHSEIHLLEIYTFVLLHPHRPTWTWKIWVVLSEWSVCFSYFHCDTSLATFSHTILTWFIFEPSPQCFIISLGKRTVESESEKVSLSPTTLWFCGLLWWFVMISMDDNIHHVHVFRPCSPGFLARGLCESESCGMVRYFLWSS